MRMMTNRRDASSRFLQALSKVPNPVSIRQHDDLLSASLDALLPSYGIDSGAAIGRLAASENHTYRVDAGVQTLVLRVHRPGYHTREEILSELDWIEALHGARAVATAVPIASREGDRLTHITVAGQMRWVSAFSHVAGCEPQVGVHLAERFDELGAINARLHQHAKSWVRPDGFVRKRWDFAAMFGADPLWGDWRAAFSTAQDLALIADLAATLNARLEAYGDAQERFGLIHGDLRLANLLDDGTRLAVIDFDDCGFGWFAYDFAGAISFHEEDACVPELQAAWLRGYRRVGAFSDADEAILPTMIMARRLLLTAWLTSRAGNDTASQFGNGFAAGTVRLARAYLKRGALP